MTELERRKALISILLVVFIDILGFTVVIPLLPFYAEHLGATPFMVGSLTAVYGICQFIAGPALGHLSDRIGRKPVLIISQIGTLTGFIILALAPSLGWLFVGRIIDGLTAGNISVAQAFVADIAGPKNRTKVFGYFGAVFGLGFIAGPALSSFLAHISLTAPLWASAGLSLFTITCNLLFLPRNTKAHHASAPQQGTDPHVASSKWQVLKNLNRPLIPFFFFTLAFVTFMSGLALFAERGLVWNGRPFGASQVGWVLTYAGTLGLIIQAGFLGLLNRFFGERKLVMAGFISMAAGYALIAPGEPALIFASVFTLSSIGSSLVRPTLTSLTSQLAHPREQGLALGVSQSLQSLSQAAAPLVTGLLIEGKFLRSWSLLCATFALLGFAFALRIPQVRRMDSAV